MEDQLLFSLVPEDAQSQSIVNDNSCYHDRVDGKRCLTFKAGTKSTLPGALVVFGSLSNISDVTIEDRAYAQMHCTFCLTPTGELVLEDRTSGHHVNLEWRDNHGVAVSYCTMKGDPRCRVIPRATASLIRVRLASDCSFIFKWRIPLDFENVERWGSILAKLYASRFKTSDMRLMAPREPNLPTHAFEANTALTPKVPDSYKRRPFIETFKYRKLGSGGFGTVFKVVNLADGEIYAMKVCNSSTAKQQDEKWKKIFKKEVENIASLQHKNIIKLIHHQGWVSGRPVEIFFKLYMGSLSAFLGRNHSCMGQFSVPQGKWILRLIDHSLSALDFLHCNGFTHRDVKPDNILYDILPGDTTPSFYLSDFGLVTSQDNMNGICGTIAYMAPETSRYGQSCQKSDMYAFGIILLEALGVYCPPEGYAPLHEWKSKLRANGVNRYDDYSDPHPCRHFAVPEAEKGHSRIQSLTAFKLLPTALSQVLDKDIKKRASAMEARSKLLERFKFLAED